MLVRNRHPDGAGFASANAPVASKSIAADAPPAAVSAPLVAPEPVTLPKAPPPPYELAGMSSLGNSTLLSILRRSDRRSVWVQVGQSVGEITAVSYDPKTDQAVIRVDDELFTLPLRTGATAEPTTQAAE